MDAEAYPEASRGVLQILWGIGASVHPQVMSKWSKARASAFDALNHYEVSLCYADVLSYVLFLEISYWLYSFKQCLEYFSLSR